MERSGHGKALYERQSQIALLAVLAVVVAASGAVAQDRPVIPYQGQLADHRGVPVSPAEPITLVFRTYSQPTRGTAQWEEAHEAVQVVAGRFSVLLGGRQPFPPDVDFRRTVYLGVTVDDGIRETADLEMRPRQAIVPAVAARQALRADWAAEAQRAEGAKWADVARQLDPDSPLMNEVERLNLVVADLISYTATLRERIQDLEDRLSSRR